MIIHFSDGTTCDFCGRYVLTALGFDFGFDGKIFCCKECADDYKKKTSRKGR